MELFNMNIFNDEHASSVMFATLMLILIVITVGSAFAFALSLNEKQYMERQSTLTAQQNENLKIISIRPIENIMNPKYWAGFDFTVFNGDISDASIKAISVNDKFMLKRTLVDDNGYFIKNVKGCPKIYNESELINVPAGQKITVHVGAIKWTEKLLNNSSTIQESPDVIYPFMDSSGWWNVTDSSGTEVNNATYIVYNGSMPGIYVPPNPNYPCNISYTMFPNSEPYPIDFSDDIFLRKAPVKVELLTQRINLFSKVFSPPIPIADVQTKSETMPDNTVSQYLVLDASSSSAPNGFITNYEWDISSMNSNSTPLGWSNSTSLSGIKQQYQITNETKYNIDLTVTDNYGMSSDLSSGPGNITIG
jgi:hypothetical protein